MGFQYLIFHVPLRYANRLSFLFTNNMYTGTYIALVFLIIVEYAAQSQNQQNRKNF